MGCVITSKTELVELKALGTLYSAARNYTCPSPYLDARENLQLDVVVGSVI